MLYFVVVFCSFLLCQDAYPGYTLYSPSGMSNDNASYLRDVDGTVYNSWSHSNGAASMPYLHPGDEPGFENSLLYYPCRVSNPSMSAGGVGGKVEIYDWDGQKLWEYELSSTQYQHHHDIDVLPNGNILMVAWERKYSMDWQNVGRTSVENSLNQMWSTVIFEIEPDLETGQTEIVWEWHIWDHLVQDISNEYESTYGVISDHPELMDINCGNAGSSGGPGGQANADWMHVNAIDYNADLDQIVFSSRHQGEIFIIDHSTTTEEAASHSGGDSGMGGDFLYRWGGPGNYERGNNADNILSSQHGVNWIPQGYPGAGNLILFNNEHSGNNAAALEIETPLQTDGSYELNGNNPYGPDTWTWIYDVNLSSAMQSGAFRLPNGNTIITEAQHARIKEVTSAGQIVYQYEYPSNNVMIARASKYAPEFFDSAYMLGDVNGDDAIDILDVVQTVNMVLGSATPSPAADMNEDGIVNVLDVIQLINVILGNNR